MRVLALAILIGLLLGACAETPQHTLHTLRPSVPWPDEPKAKDVAAAASEAPKHIDATPISSYSPATDAQIQAVLVERSVAGFEGACPCPYSVDRAGQRCGERSAYSMSTRTRLLCFPRDVTEEMIADYRARR